jgi:hypothetical protein
LAEPEARKALVVIEGLRRIAYEVTEYRDARECLRGLLLDALFVATRAPEGSPQRELALLFVAVPCDRLQHWRQPWPPTDWDVVMAQDERFSLVEH